MFMIFYSLEVGETFRVNRDEISPFLPFWAMYDKSYNFYMCWTLATKEEEAVYLHIKLAELCFGKHH